MIILRHAAPLAATEHNLHPESFSRGSEHTNEHTKTQIPFPARGLSPLILYIAQAEMVAAIAAYYTARCQMYCAIGRTPHYRF